LRRHRLGGELMPEDIASSWGRLSLQPHRLEVLRDRDALQLTGQASDPAIAYGNGRSYGDVCLNGGGRLWDTRGLDRFVRFDVETGVLEAEAGVLLRDITAVVLPKGWFLPVTPGTQEVTLGGAIANDVHGKNHHCSGTFGEHVLSIELARTDGSRMHCSGNTNADWLRATIGGLGLTGVIASARIQLLRVPGPWLDVESLPFASLDEFFALSRESEPAWQYAVSWIDCIGGSRTGVRGVFFRGNHGQGTGREPRQHERFLPPMPVSLVNAVSLRLFNSAYFQAHRRARGRRRQHFRPFFYPLDHVQGWNRLYGPRGFYQYQCVLPRACERPATAELLRQIKQSGVGSFLAVLKTFADRPSAGLLSFPMAGTTLALDFPNQGEVTLRFFERLDRVVAEARGRLYPAKDARMSRAMFEEGYPALDVFVAFRDPGISSAMSRRLLGK
jgi:FAD/FMN-containing dehydrogenase